MKVVELYPSNLRDPAATLRVIADEIEQGKYGEVGTAGVVLLGDTLEVFGMGVDSSGPSTAVVLHAGFNKLMGIMVEHGYD